MLVDESFHKWICFVDVFLSHPTTQWPLSMFIKHQKAAATQQDSLRLLLFPSTDVNRCSCGVQLGVDVEYKTGSSGMPQAAAHRKASACRGLHAWDWCLDDFAALRTLNEFERRISLSDINNLKTLGR